MRKLFFSSAILAFAACTSTPQVAVIEPSDTHLSCQEIYRESASLQTIMDEAHHNKGFNLANFFAWPGPIYSHNFIEADNAEEWVQRRRVALTDLYIQKGCAPDVAVASASTSDLTGKARAQRIVEDVINRKP